MLVLPGLPPIAELGEAGVQRVSIGSMFAWASYAKLANAAIELRDKGTYGFGDGVREAYRAIADAFN